MPISAAAIPEIFPNDTRLTPRGPRKLDILILAGFVRSLDWSESLWVPDLAHALAARGHKIEIALDGCDDPTLFKDLPFTIYRPDRKHFGAEPFAFRRWARGMMHARPDSACLSFTPWVCGDVWLPIGKRANEVVHQLFAAHRPLAAIMELLHHPWLIHELLAERKAMRDSPRRRAAPLTIGPHAEGSSLRSLGYAARLLPLSAAEKAAAREQIRSALSIAPNERVLLLSGTHTREQTAAYLMQALAMLQRSATPSRSGPALSSTAPPLSPPTIRLLATGRYPHTLEVLARDAGCNPPILHTGTHADIRKLLAASDVAVAAFGDTGSGTGRFVCEAIRAGLPVIVASQAPGADLADSGHHKPGIVVHDDSPEGWLAAFGKVLDDRWMESARAAAASVAPDLTIPRLVERLESYLQGALR